MNFIDNRRWLGQHQRDVLEIIQEWDNIPSSGSVVVEPSRKGDKTLSVNTNGMRKQIHSKYDPRKESDRLLGETEKNNDPILFFGTGLGYHIESFIEKYPYRKFAIFEPNIEVFLAFMKRISFKKIMPSNLLGILIGNNDLETWLNQTIKSGRKKLGVVTLPAYQDIYQEQFELLYKTIIERVKDYKNSTVTELAFQMRWILNSIKNFPEVTKTFNITLNKDKKYFENKTAFIVAAGPSLDFEYENIKTIKEKKLGFIFSVGSAINSLIEQGIHPHATFTYDPKSRNARVIQKLKDFNIQDIPLVFGSSVGYETLKDYPGEKYHFVTSQDSVGQSLLQADMQIPIINDAPSIAVITLQILIELGFGQIVFIGQNLSYPTETRHASGINYETFYTPTLTEKEKKGFIEIDSVDGKSVETDESMLMMKQQLEIYIEKNRNVNFINTTQKGANIKGTNFQPLLEVINEVVEPSKINKNYLFEDLMNYNLNYTKYNLEQLEIEMIMLDDEIRSSMEKLQHLALLVDSKQKNVLEIHFGQFDRIFKKVEENYFYKTIIKRVIRFEHKELTHMLSEVRNINDVIYKGKVTVTGFNHFLNIVSKYYLWARPLFLEMKKEVNE